MFWLKDKFLASAGRIEPRFLGGLFHRLISTLSVLSCFLFLYPVFMLTGLCTCLIFGCGVFPVALIEGQTAQDMSCQHL
jgi:hypothetical protein